MADFVYPYPPLLAGTLVRRYKRFFAEIELATGGLITAHCPNTGPMTGLYLPGHPVMVSRSTNPKRALAYTWEMVEVYDNGPTWVGVNTALPNRVVKQALMQKVLPTLEDYHEVRSEVVYGLDGKSRVDFVLYPDATQNGTGDPRPVYVEVKSTTWVQGPLALFPDTVTTRGQKHLRELCALLPEKRAVMLYFINRGDCNAFSPGDRADPVYGELLREAIAAGLEVLPCRFEVSPEGVRFQGLADLKLRQPVG